MKNTILICILLILIGCKSQKPVVMTSAYVNEGSHYLDFMEKITLEVMAELYVQELTLDSREEFEKECLRRIKAQYSEEEITILKQKIPKDYQAPYKNRIEILQELIIFQKTKYKLKTQELKEQIINELSIEEQEILSTIRKQYFTDLKYEYNKKREKIEGNKLLTKLEIEGKLSALNLSQELATNSLVLPENWSEENHLSILTEIAKKQFQAISQSNHKLLIELRKEWIKINLGRIGNFSPSIISFNSNREELKTFTIIELLLIE